MRDPARIDEFCDRLKEVWRLVPDWRFGQLAVNLFGDISSTGKDPFYVEDPEMIKYLESRMKSLYGENLEE